MEATVHNHYAAEANPSITNEKIYSKDYAILTIGHLLKHFK